MQQPRKLNPDQLKKIHTLRRQIGMDEEQYRDMLKDNFSVESSKDLTLLQARDLLDRLDRILNGGQLKAPFKKWENYDGRAGMATAAQLRMVEAMWKDVSRQKTAPEREAALKEFLSSRFQIADITWMEKKHVQKVVKTLKVMLRQQRDAAEKAKKEAA